MFDTDSTIHTRCPLPAKIYIIATAAAILTAGCGSRNTFFTGCDLTGWGAFPADKTHLWSVKNGIIHCEGTSQSYLRSDKNYQNYHLHVEWRWPKTPGSSGVTVHTFGWDKFWPNGIELSLSPNNAGDFYLCGPGLTATKFDIPLGDDAKLPMRIPRHLDSSDNLPGEWNSLDIFCKNDSIQVFINGFMQNEIACLSHTSGGICLLSQSAPIEFKNIYLNPLR